VKAHSWLPKSAAGEALTLWAVCFAATFLSYALFTDVAKLVATLGFLYLPVLAMERRGEDYPDYGLTLRTWRTDLKLFLVVSAVVFPLFIAGYGLGLPLLAHIPREWLHLFTPDLPTPHFAFRLPSRFGEWVIDQYFVVALPEEFFYRGYLLTRLRDAWPQGRLFFGVRLGPAFWVTALVFALGHLAIFQVWRLWVFFPALVFAWLRQRTGSVLAAAAFHGSSNLLLQVLNASFFGG
jgi:membrane protease YdiL (CAAX protease family)